MECAQKMGRSRVLAYTVLSLGAFSMLVPFLWMLATSLMSTAQIYAFPPKLMPDPLQWQNYPAAMDAVPLGRFFWNSLLVAVLTTAGQMVTASMAGYAFARLHFPFRNGLFLLFLATMMIPPQVNIVPLFMLMSRLGWIDTYAALIVPGLFGAFGIFLLRQWFLGFPVELEQAARLDGCNPFQIYWHVALPTALPALATLGIFTFISTWNSFLWPLIVTNSEMMRTLPVGLAAFKGAFRETTEWGQLMAAGVISVLPALGVFLIGQKYFIQGLMSGSLKG
ncbi:MAG: carbohydrate ABC transporter permease [Candidatus Sericytochromatia bacterium]|nr:carbohydrate ABC transporter permease [Candidatus Sericytochromatia bacterium]